MLFKTIIKIFKDLGIEERNDTGIGYPELILAESYNDNKIQDTKILYIPHHYIKYKMFAWGMQNITEQSSVRV